MRGNSMKSLGLLFVGSGFATMAGAWSGTFGEPGYNDIGYAVQQTADGGCIIAGSTESFGTDGWDAWLIKLDASGNKQWDMPFGGSGYGSDDYAYSVRWTADGGYLIAGTTESYGAGGDDAWLIKTDGSGNRQWEKTFGGPRNDFGYAAQQTADGGYILAGTTTSYGVGGSDVWLIKLDADGYEKWKQPLGGPNYDYGYAVQQTADGGYIITGATNSYSESGTSSGYDAWLLKTDANGKKQWSQAFGGPNYDYGYAVQQTADGGYVIAGTKDASSGPNNADHYSDTYLNDKIDGTIWLLKTDARGKKQWEQTFGGPSRGASVQQTADGGYVIAGTKVSYSTNNTASNLDAVLIKTNARGAGQWTKTLSLPDDNGGLANEFGLSAQQTSDGGYIFTGSTNSFLAGYYDVFLIKADANGNW